MITPLSPAVLTDFISYETSVPDILDRLNAPPVIEKQKTILIKPNIVTADPFPVTTHPEFCSAVITYIRSCSDADIIIAEGCGDSNHETHELFRLLGYETLADRFKIPLIDLNHEHLVRLENHQNTVFPEMYLPEIALSSFILSLPVLKAHSLAHMTGTLKNMMGFAPPSHYSGRYGVWKKSVFHERMQEAIIDLNRFITPDLTVLDASLGLASFHLGGPTCSPPVNRLVAGFDPVSVDRKAADLLGLDWRKIRHITPH